MLNISKNLQNQLAKQEDRGSIPGLATWIFRDWLSPASKSRYGWTIAKSTLILKTTNQPTKSTKLGSIVGDGGCVELEEVFPFPDVPFCYKQNVPNR